MLEQLVHLFLPVLRVPALLGLLPLRHRHGRDHHGGARDHGSIGVSTKYVTEVVAKVYEHGNNLGIPPAAWKDNCEFLEEDVQEQTGVPIRFPVDDRAPTSCWCRLRPTTSPTPTR